MAESINGPHWMADNIRRNERLRKMEPPEAWPRPDRIDDGTSLVEQWILDSRSLTYGEYLELPIAEPRMVPVMVLSAPEVGNTSMLNMVDGGVVTYSTGHGEFYGNG